MAMELADQREFPRLAAKAGVRFRVIECEDPSLVVEASITDFSSRGVLLESPRKLRYEDVLKIELTLPELSVNAFAQVAWMQQVGSAWKTGLRFFGISEADEDSLAELVQRSLKKRPRRSATD